MCGLRKGDQSGGSNIGDLGRIPGRALGKVALLEADSGCSGKGHTAEVGTGRGYLLGTEHHTEILREEVWRALNRKAGAAVVDTSVAHLWASLAPAWAWVSAPPWGEAQGGVSGPSYIYPKSQVATQEHSG